MSEEIVRKQLDAINRHDAAGYASTYAADCVIYDPQHPEPLRGRDAAREDMATFFKSFPDLSAKAENILVTGDRMAFEGHFSGTNAGPLAMPGGEIPATNRRVDMTGAMFVRTNSQGEIVEERRYFNMLEMMMQLGLMPEG